ncbi:MAG: hypothetical protein ACE3L7_09045 [Candidatus Pristimantibacillus sp.]
MYIAKPCTLQSLAEKFDLSVIYLEKVFSNLSFPRTNYNYSPFQKYVNFESNTTLLESPDVDLLTEILSKKRTVLQFSRTNHIDLCIVRGAMNRVCYTRSKNIFVIPAAKLGDVLRDAKNKASLCSRLGIKPSDIEFKSQLEINKLISELTSVFSQPAAMPTRYVYGRTPNDKLGSKGVGKEHKEIPPGHRR